MVGSGAAGGGGGDHARSKEAAGMMALHEALRNVCLNSDWTYSVFWTIRPRPRCRGGNGCKVGDDNGSLMLMWEDGFCRPRMAECLEDMEGEDPVRKAFSKMSIQLFNWPGQPQLPHAAASPLFPPGPAAFHPSARSSMPHYPGGGGGKDEGHMYHLAPSQHGKPPHLDEHQHQQQMQPGEAPDGDLKWPNGLSFFTALTGRSDDSKLLYGGPGGGGGGGADDGKPAQDAQTGHGGAENVEEYLSLESHSNKARRMENTQSAKFKRSFTLPARMSSSNSPSPSVSASTGPAPQQQQQGMEYRAQHEGSVYSDLMETFLE
ncbi:unnamed protein product [Triticum turgidum subsp. durum]|uniref:Transcription factor MYC/MYB N-terminal domain-containing protein n=1 Tax=Triticum turgidum subsp. durum TaxID=4567 RepID=A0A9R1QQ92_TRITD|nr:unnamed protein product [Triticum turgidum subsp. durum]